jgi:hypothetical protein
VSWIPVSCNSYPSWIELCLWLGMIFLDKKIDSLEDTIGVVSDYLMIFFFSKFK